MLTTSLGRAESAISIVLMPTSEQSIVVSRRFICVLPMRNGMRRYGVVPGVRLRWLNASRLCGGDAFYYNKFAARLLRMSLRAPQRRP